MSGPPQAIKSLDIINNIMAWETISINDELIILQRSHRGYNARIEARSKEEGWAVYRTFHNDKGLSLTEEFEAKTREEVHKIITTLKTQSPEPLQNLQKRMLSRNKKATVSIERSYKEYNVEKWFFAVQGDRAINFAVVRFYDQIEIDFVIHHKYTKYEQEIVDRVGKALGLNNMDEDIVTNIYYFSKTNGYVQEQKKKILGRIEFGLE